VRLSMFFLQARANHLGGSPSSRGGVDESISRRICSFGLGISWENNASFQMISTMPWRKVSWSIIARATSMSRGLAGKNTLSRLRGTLSHRILHVNRGLFRLWLERRDKIAARSSGTSRARFGEDERQLENCDLWLVEDEGIVKWYQCWE
jgi:hypothetical protein